MAESKNIGNLSALDDQDRDSLVLACLKNRWLSLGIHPLRQDPLLSAQFPLLRAESLQDLCDFFRMCPYGIREGVVFEDLAFVQQVHLGDEWLVLRRVFDDETGDAFWEPFESVSFGKAVRSTTRFECLIGALQNQDPYETAAMLGRSETFSEKEWA